MAHALKFTGPVLSSRNFAPRTRVASLPLSKITAQILESKSTPSLDSAPQESSQYENLDKYDASAAIRQRSRDFTLVETPKQLQSMLQELAHAGTLAIDCEGINLGQPQGQLCLLQIAARQASHAAAGTSNNHAKPMQQQPGSKSTPSGQTGSHESTGASRAPERPAATAQEGSPASSSSSRKSNSNSSHQSTRPLSIYIVDIHQMQWRAFHYRMDPGDPTSINLKGLLESTHITKLIYDVRSDASNLLRQFDIRLRGAYDLQLAEVAVRQMSGVPAKWVFPLEKSLSNSLPRSTAMEQDIRHGHYVAKHYHQGNRMEVWQERPLSEELLHYAASDVRYLHLLEEALNHQLPPMIVQKVRNTTMTRTRTGDLPGMSRSSAPEIVRPSDIRQMTQQQQRQELQRRS